MKNEMSSKQTIGFNEIASTFLGAGAICTQLLMGETIIESLPVGALPAGQIIIVKSTTNISMNIYGLTGPFWESTAETMIELYSRQLQFDYDLESLTAAFIETQDRLVSFYDFGKAVRRVVEIPTLLELVVNEVCAQLFVCGAFAILLRKKHPGIIYQHSRNFLSEDFIYSQTAKYKAVKTQNTFLIEHEDSINNVRGLFLPILNDDQVFATLCIYAQPNDLASPDIKLASALAEQIGAQLENALLVQESIEKTSLETEMKLARQVQTALLPQLLPDITGLDLYATSKPALEVGGDFFDLIIHQGEPLIFVLGDVTGKGMPAALLMTMTRTVARSAARNMPFSAPHQLVNRLNVDLIDDYSTVGMFSTGFVGVLNQENHRLEYCNAGQSPIIYIPKNGNPVMLEAQDIPIGIFDGYVYSSHSLPFFPGDILIVASDGFPEARNSFSEMFGYNRMVDFLSSHRDLSAKELTESLLDAVTSFTGDKPQDDDQTIILIKMV